MRFANEGFAEGPRHSDIVDAEDRKSLLADKRGSLESPTQKPSHGYLALKRAMDVFGALVIAFIFLPVLIIAPILIKRDGGPVFFRQTRVGKNGKYFSMLKFRTMVPNAESVLDEVLSSCPDRHNEWVTTQKLRNDPRVTRFGGWLRSTSIDEIPQLWNVLKGDMSIVGPRPMFPEQRELFGRYLEVVLQATPGCTGLWQVRGRNERTFIQRARTEYLYVKRRSFWMDIGIALRTPHAMFARRSGV